MSKLILVMLLLTVIGSGWSADISQALDSVLKGLRVRAVADGRRQVGLRDFERRSDLGPTEGVVNCTGGWARDMSTLVRTGDSRLEVKNGRLVLATRIGVSSLEFGYTNCQLNVGHLLGVKVGFTVTAKNSSVDAVLSMGKTCTLLLDGVEPTAGAVEVTLGGQGILAFLKDELLTLLLRHFQEGFMGLVKEELTRLAEDNIARLQYC